MTTPAMSHSIESSYRCIREIPQTRPVSAIAFNSTLTYLATASPQGPFQIWDITTGHEVYHELHPHACHVGALAWITFPGAQTELLLTASDVILPWKYSAQQKARSNKLMTRFAPWMD
ncbi:hypothetical protein BDZ89DRAFT_1150927 [Hymenopellis radicata]|nr:hypothetical protein BDZ89DRAFT_1150927 [Hymenopellis radicata]